MVTLGEAKPAIDHWLKEARVCIGLPDPDECGFSALLTTFAVLQAVTEAVTGRTATAQQIKWFAGKMTGEATWLLNPQSHRTIGNLLVSIRGNLDHTLAVPDSVRIARHRQRGEELLAEDNTKTIICVAEFIAAVTATIDGLLPAAKDEAMPSSKHEAVTTATRQSFATATGSGGMRRGPANGA